MKTRAHFICEKCGFENTDVNKVMACEAKHLNIEKAEVQIYETGHVFPEFIKVTFSDGTRYSYREQRKMDKDDE